MTKNIEKIVKIDIQSFQDMCEKITLYDSHIAALRAENEILRDENETYFETCNDLIKQIHKLRAENDNLRNNIESEVNTRMANMTIWDLPEEAQAEAGHLLAKDLLGHRMTPEEVAISETESRYDYYKGDDF